MVEDNIQEDSPRRAPGERQGRDLRASVITMQGGLEAHSGLDTLYRRYRTQARRTASRFYPFDAAEAEDVVQDVFVSLCETINRIDVSRPMAGWIGRATTNRCHDRRRREFVTQETLRANAPTGVTSELEARIEGRDALSHIMSALRRLPVQQARAFQEHYLQGVEQKTIAEQLGVTNGYVSKMLKMARSALLQEIHESAPRRATKATCSSRESALTRNGDGA